MGVIRPTQKGKEGESVELGTSEVTVAFVMEKPYQA